MRITLAVAVACLAIGGVAAADRATAAIRKTTEIPAQGLGPALTSLAKEFDFQVLYRTEVVGTLHTQGAVGEFTSDEALKQLLDGTGLTFRYLDEETVTITPAGTAVPSQNSVGAYDAEQGDDAQKENQSQGGDQKKTFWGYFRLAQATPSAKSGMSPQHSVRGTRLAQAGTVPTGPEGRQQQEKATNIDEVIVTAQKRSERLQDVPIPVTAINADSLVENNRFRLEDYYNNVPGLSLAFETPPQQILSIRGLTTGPGNATVGITIDDVPSAMQDIDPADLARVEVLRGPQGTLYGASSMGGLLKFVTADPSTAGYSGRLQVGTSSVSHGDDLGYNVHGYVNVPVSDTFAVRVSGFDRQDPGYIDNPVLDIKDINKQDVYGGRVAALWQPTDSFSVKLTALSQRTTAHGSSDTDVQAGLGDLQQNYVRGVGGSDIKTQAYSAVVKAKVGSIDLTSITGYNIDDMSRGWDFSYTGSALSIPLFNVEGTPLYTDSTTYTFSQEVRASIPLGPHVDWMLGGFYSHASLRNQTQDLLAADPVTGVVAGSLAHFEEPVAGSEVAAFTDFTFHFSDRFDLQVGGRQAKIKSASSETDYGLYPLVVLGADPSFHDEVRSDDSAFTYLVTPQFKVSRDFMVYARLASGYRAGGPNLNSGGSIPGQYEADKTQNYEVGLKGSFLDRMLYVDASAYYIDWKNIQLFLLDEASGFSYIDNASRAKSQGVELSLEAKPMPGLSIDAWVVWNDAELTEGFPSTSTANGVSGDRLPFASRFSANLSVSEEFPLANQLSGFVGGTVSYVGDREGVFTDRVQAGEPDVLRQDLPAYAKVDVLAGLKRDSWTASLFVNNLTDRRVFISGGVGTFPPFAFQYIRPRTIGLSLAKTF